MWLTAVEKKLLFSKNDPDDPRLGECVESGRFDFQSVDLFQASPTADFHLLGYPDDEGIALNGGRPGAATAPSLIRQYLYKMTPRLNSAHRPRLADLGDFAQTPSLQERHERGRRVIGALAWQNKKFISFGGGHDYGYSDACGFLDAHAGNAVVINFDAHLDVRDTSQGFHSGTPFRRMLSEFKDRVDFFEVGLQDQCNSQRHLEWAASQGAHITTLREISEHGLLPLLKKSLTAFKNKKVFISLDIDAFSSSEAPGCSQSWATGLHCRDFLPSMAWLIREMDVCGLGIYEVSPALDIDFQTSKLAALITHHFIFDSLESPRARS